MNSRARGQLLKQAKSVFFRAMLVGYAGGDGSEVTKDKTSDGYITMTYQEGLFRFVDRYCVRPDSDKSAGTTTIFYDDLPIWWMCYSGQYPEKAIPCLKEALAKAYRRGMFVGGRGPKHYIHFDSAKKKRPLRYFNFLNGNGKFFHGRFSGREEIHDYRKYGHPRRGNSFIGYHDYQGGPLI